MSKRKKKISKLDIILNESNKRKKRSSILIKYNVEHDKILTLNAFFKQLSAFEIYNSCATVQKNSFFENLPLISKKTKISNFYSACIPETDLERSISYILSCMKIHINELNEFIENEKEITSLIIANEIEEAINEIEKINQKFGFSLWGINTISALYDIIDKTEIKKKYLNEFNSKTPNVYLKYIVNTSSSRYDKMGVFIQGIHTLKNSLSTLSSNISEHLIFKLAPLDYQREYDFEKIFNEEKNSSIIDCYCTLKKYILHSLYNTDNCNDTLLKRIVNFFNKNTHCDISTQIDKVINNNTSWEFNAQDYYLIDAYTIGDYNLVKGTVDETPSLLNKFNLFEIYTKSLIRKIDSDIKTNKFLSSIISNLVDLYEKNTSYAKSYNNLLSLSFSLDDFFWFKQLSLLILQEDKFFRNKYKNLYHIISNIDSPAKMMYFNNAKSSDFFEALKKFKPDSFCLDLFLNLKNKNLIDNSIIKDNNRVNKYNALTLISQERYDEAIKILKTPIDNKDHLSNNEQIEILSQCYTESKNHNENIKFFMEKTINNKALITLFDIKKICDEIKENINNISIIQAPNVLSIYNRFIDEQFKPILRYSLENFFMQNNLTTVDDLINKKEDYPIDQLNYFLEYVCIPDNMKLTLLFNGTDDIETNRIKICNYLLEDGKNDIISEELKSIAKSQVLKVASKQVEHSKIYADTTKLRSVENNGIIEIYNKYLEIKNNDYSNDESEIFLLAIVDKLIKIDDKFSKIEYLSEVTNEKNELFQKILFRIRDEFVFGVNGINSNLSTRIRHGHFPSTLRKSLIEENLITTQIKDSNEFKSNEHWLNILKPLNEEKISQIDILFKNFSKKIEELITEVNDKWLQVKLFNDEIRSLVNDPTDNKKYALFDYSLTFLESYHVQVNIASYNSYQDFIKSIIEWLWARTDKNLIIIRNNIEIKLKERIFSLLKNFQQDIHGIIDNENITHEFNNSIGRCKESLNINLGLISSWFKRSEQNEVSAYEFETVVEIANRAADTITKNLIDRNYIFKGKTLTSFVDVLYIIFENARSKSLLNKSDLKINLLLENDKNGNNILRITNNCKPIENIEHENSILDPYREKYYKFSEFLDFAQGEGRTGLIKIAKILYKDLELEHSVKFGYTNENTFSIEFTFSNFHKVINE